MNCCDDYGVCRGGHGCPAGGAAAEATRKTKAYPAVPPDAASPAPARLLGDFVRGYAGPALFVVVSLLALAAAVVVVVL